MSASLANILFALPTADSPLISTGASSTESSSSHVFSDELTQAAQQQIQTFVVPAPTTQSDDAAHSISPSSTATSDVSTAAADAASVTTVAETPQTSSESSAPASTQPGTPLKPIIYICTGGHGGGLFCGIDDRSESQQPLVGVQHVSPQPQGVDSPEIDNSVIDSSLAHADQLPGPESVSTDFTLSPNLVLAREIAEFTLLITGNKPELPATTAVAPNDHVTLDATVEEPAVAAAAPPRTAPADPALRVTQTEATLVAADSPTDLASTAPHSAEPVDESDASQDLDESTVEGDLLQSAVLHFAVRTSTLNQTTEFPAEFDDESLPFRIDSTIPALEADSEITSAAPASLKSSPTLITSAPGFTASQTAAAADNETSRLIASVIAAPGNATPNVVTRTADRVVQPPAVASGSTSNSGPVSTADQTSQPARSQTAHSPAATIQLSDDVQVAAHVEIISTVADSDTYREPPAQAEDASLRSQNHGDRFDNEPLNPEPLPEPAFSAGPQFRSTDRSTVPPADSPSEADATSDQPAVSHERQEGRDSERTDRNGRAPQGAGDAPRPNESVTDGPEGSTSRSVQPQADSVPASAAPVTATMTGPTIAAPSAVPSPSQPPVSTSDPNPVPVTGQIASSIVQRLQSWQQAGEPVRHIAVRLDPPELGALRIQVRTTDDGLHMKVEAAEDVTLEMLATRVPEIEQLLRHQEIDLSRVTIHRMESDIDSSSAFDRPEGSTQDRDLSGEADDRGQHGRGDGQPDSRQTTNQPARTELRRVLRQGIRA